MKKQKMEPPKILLDSIKAAADEFKKSLEVVGWLSGERSSPMPERNTVVHLAHAFLGKGFAVYAEPTLRPTRKKKHSRIDLLASNSKYSFIFEVKTFGARDLSKIQKDAEKLEAYKPWAANLIDGSGTETDFWNKSEKWAVVLIQSHSGEEFTELWNNQLKNSFNLKKELRKYPRLQSPGEKKFVRFTSFLHDLSALRDLSANVGSYPVCGKRWEGDYHSIDLLWAAFRK